MGLALAACSGGGSDGGVAGGPAPTPPGPPALALLAGHTGGFGTADGRGSEARFDLAGPIAVDRAGNVYVADTNNFTVRKIDSTGMVTTLAGKAGEQGTVDGLGSAARLPRIGGIAIDALDNLYVTGANQVRKITPAGAVTVLAGSGATATLDSPDAAFDRRGALAADANGNLYVAEGPTVRKVFPDGRVTTLAGMPGQSAWVDGAGAAARFTHVAGIAVDALGDLYVTDQYSHTVRRISPAGEVTTIAGNGSRGGADGAGAQASFYSPSAITIDSAGILHVGERNLSHTGHNIRSITRAGLVTTTFTNPQGQDDIRGLAPAPGGALYIGHFYGVDTLAGGVRIPLAGALPDSAAPRDGTGGDARFGTLFDAVADAAGNLYVADYRSLRRITPRGEVSTFFTETRTNAWLAAVAFDGQGRLHFSSMQCGNPRGGLPFCQGEIHRLDASGAAERLVPRTSTDATGTHINQPIALVIDAAGNVYFAEVNDAVVRKLTPGGDLTTVAGSYRQRGSQDGVATAAHFVAVRDMVMDASGNLVVSDAAGTIRRITPAREVITIAGAAEQRTTVDGPGVAARFQSPEGLALDPAGNLYVADVRDHVIRKMAPNGMVTTIAGVPGAQGFKPGPLPGTLSAPRGIAVYGSDLYLAIDTAIAVIRNRP